MIIDLTKNRNFQKSRIPPFSCSFSGNCDLTPKSRRRCQQCRYDRCIVAVMNPDLVLNEGQKLFRFRDKCNKAFFAATYCTLIYRRLYIFIGPWFEDLYEFRPWQNFIQKYESELLQICPVHFCKTASTNGFILVAHLRHINNVHLRRLELPN